LVQDWTAEQKQLTVNEKGTAAAGITTFVDAGGESIIDYAKLDIPEIESLNVNKVDSIRDFLARPRRAATFNWSTTQAQNDLIFGFDSSNGLFGNPIGEKLRGFAGVRYTTNVKVLINATPFQAGRLRLAALPDLQYTTKYRFHTNNIMSFSQLPGLEITTAMPSIEMSMPYTHFAEYWDFQTPNFMSFQLRVMSPLRNGTADPTQTVSGSVWVWFTDVEFFGVRKESNVEMEEERPLSKWLEASSKLAKAASAVPILSSITGPTANWLKMASGTANSLGFSRPVAGEPNRIVSDFFHRHFPNSEGVVAGPTLAANNDAAIRTLAFTAPGGQDEMSFNFIKRRWSWAYDVVWNTTDVEQIDTNVLRPGFASIGAPGSTRAVPPIDYLALLSTHYRGGLEVMLKFVKTGFHTGSLAVSFENDTSSGTLTLAQTDNLHRTIVDLQQGDSVCLSFPYIDDRQWLPNSQAYGRMFIHVVNALRAPQTVSQSVVIQVWVRGMEDLQFTGRSSSTVIPVRAESGRFSDLGRIRAEGADTMETGEIICQPVGGKLTIPQMHSLQVMDSMSEAWTSLRQYCKLPHKLAYPSSLTNTVRLVLNPSVYLAKVGTTYPDFALGMFPAYKMPFLYQRGGHEINVFSGREGITVGMTYISAVERVAAQAFEVSAVPADTMGSARTLYGFQTEVPSRGFMVPNARVHGLEVRVPYKNRYKYSPIIPVNSSTEIIGLNQCNNLVEFIGNPADSVWVRGADDYQLSFFLGIPAGEY